MTRVNRETEFIEIAFEVEPNYAGWRLDRYLCEKIKRLSRTRVQKIIETSLVSERPMKASSLLVRGQKFQLRRVAREEPSVPDIEALKEIFKDDSVLVVDKPAGLPIHPTARYHHHTMTAQLKRRYGDAFQADPAHRLDRETSGLLVCGIGAEVSRRLMESFQSSEVHKEYVAVCEGHPAADEFEVDAAIAEGTEEIRIAVRIDAVQGRPAQTRFVVTQRFEREGTPFSLLRCFPLTGRQHQIRIHARHAGFPLVGDKMYGPDPMYFDRFSKHTLEPEAWARLRLPRHALHAARLSFPHPRTRERLTFESPLPHDLAGFVRGEAVEWPATSPPATEWTA